MARALDRYIESDSPLHRLDARVKLSLAVAFILGVALQPPGAWASYACLALLCSVAVGVSRVPAAIVRRSALALPFVLVAVPLVFSRPGATVWQGALGPWTLIVTDTGLVDFASILVKSLMSVVAALVLAATTRMPQLLHALRWYRVPAALVSVIGFMYRYLFVIVDEAERLIRARAARSAGSAAPFAWRVRVTGSMVGSLFLRSYERSERIYAAMLARGYDGTFRVLHQPLLSRSDVAVALAGVCAIAVVSVPGALLR